MTFLRRSLSTLACLLWCGTLEAQLPTKGYATSLVLHGPTEAGPGQTISGSGAPDAPGVYVELWRSVYGSARAESLGCVAAQPGGTFSFPGVDVEEGDQYHVTLSRSWHFDVDGDPEGWDAAVSVDAVLEVSGGTLKVMVRDGDGNGYRDPYFQAYFDYNTAYYRVIEIRLRNPAPVTPAYLSSFWGEPWPSSVSFHKAEIPAAMSGFQTVLIPLNVDEVKVLPSPQEAGVDGLWTADTLHTTLRIDPLDSLPQGESGADGTVFEIESIRIREDYRFDFEESGDLMGLAPLSGMSDVAVKDGFLGYTASENPTLDFLLSPGKLESGQFARFVIGIEGGADSRGVAVSFNDADSADSYVDDDGSSQRTFLDVGTAGRQDVSVISDDVSSGEWTEDGRVPVQGLRLEAPVSSVAGDPVLIDYVGWVPSNPFGPSAPVFVAPTNRPPVAVVSSRPDPAIVTIQGADAGVFLDGSGSSDGDGGSQGLAFLWEKVAGPAGAKIDAATAPWVNLSFTRPGDYLYRLTVDDGQTLHSTATTEVAVSVESPLFLRGDVDTDGSAGSISDAIHLVKVLFGWRTLALSCPDAADADDDGRLALSDVLMLLFHTSGVSMPPASCVTDETPDGFTACDYPQEFCATSGS